MNYNNPCFSCNSKISFTLNLINRNTLIETPLKPVTTQKYIKFKLLVGYDSCLELVINRITNQFSSNDPEFLMTHLKSRDIRFTSYCIKCGTSIQSNMAALSFDNGFIKPLTISREYLIAKVKNYEYVATTIFEENKSHLLIVDKKKNSLDNFSISTSLLPLYKIKTKQKFIDKLKLYAVFS
jgi:hypothetical protein